MHNDIIRRIKERKATIGIVGLGYVGLPLALASMKRGSTSSGWTSMQRKPKS